jgi:hypothetical protein
MDKVIELAELFKERENQPYQPYIGTYLADGTIRLKSNILLKPGKYVNAIPKCTCAHTCSTVSDGGYQASSHKHEINCDHDINIKEGDSVVVIKMGEIFIAIARVRT